MNIRIKLYTLLVNRVPAIQKEYHRLRQERNTKPGRIYAWLKLVAMNIGWLLGSRKLEKKMIYPDMDKRMPERNTESDAAVMVTPEDMESELLKADVISFDIFDTLIHRVFSNPTDVFFMVGERLGIPDFKTMRELAEWKVRQAQHNKTGSYEVSLEQIYDQLSYDVGMDAGKGMRIEVETELMSTFANPYMLEVYEEIKAEARKAGKRIICTSDMYISSDVLMDMLRKAGYGGIDHIYVSCETGMSKADGSLYEYVKEHEGNDKIFVHVGDNPQSDIDNAMHAGWKAYVIKNVNVYGMPYRAEDMSVITGSLYRGVVNSRIYSGLHRYSRNYEIGYIYGGIFVLGYCQFIHEYAIRNGLDKILFLSRDGDIVKKVYDYMYGQEDIHTEYVYWSRTVATKLMAAHNRYDYLRRFIDHKVNKKHTIYEVLRSAGIEDMLSSDMNGNQILNDKNAAKLKQVLLHNWEEVVEHYNDEKKAANIYYNDVLKGCRNVAAVDVGWAGSGALALNYLVNEDWNIGCNIIGIVAGTNSFNNVETNASESFLYSGRLVSYMYSQEFNRDIWRWHNPSKNHNLLVELLLSSKQGSLKGFGLTEDGYELIFKESDVKECVVDDIQSGIMDYVKDYCLKVPYEFRKGHIVSGRDAYAVLKIYMQSNVEQMLDEGI